MSNDTSVADEDGKEILSKASIIGIVIGLIAFCCILATILFFVRRRNKQIRLKMQPDKTLLSVPCPGTEAHGTSLYEMGQGKMVQETVGSTVFVELNSRCIEQNAYELPTNPREQGRIEIE